MYIVWETNPDQVLSLFSFFSSLFILYRREKAVLAQPGIASHNICLLSFKWVSPSLLATFLYIVVPFFCSVIHFFVSVCASYFFMILCTTSSFLLFFPFSFLWSDLIRFSSLIGDNMKKEMWMGPYRKKSNGTFFSSRLSFSFFFSWKKLYIYICTLAVNSSMTIVTMVWWTPTICSCVVCVVSSVLFLVRLFKTRGRVEDLKKTFFYWKRQHYFLLEIRLLFPNKISTMLNPMDCDRLFFILFQKKITLFPSCICVPTQ